MARRLLTILCGLTLAALLYVGARGASPLPPLGALLHPASGGWAVGSNAEWPKEAEADIGGLAAEVQIRFDDRGVPHIFARNRLDATRALGYVTARDRLFQMELQVRAAEGKLTEFVGARALPLDRRTQALGMPWGIRRRWAATPHSVREVLTAYADGVNAWIGRAHGADLPLEYLLIGARPRAWQPAYTLALQMELSRTLSLSDDEALHEMVAARVGMVAARALYPLHSPLVEPVVPTTSGPRLDSTPLPPPSPGAASAIAPQRLDSTLAEAGRQRGTGSGVGSNSWAVLPERTRDGVALLANDPHLGLTLPSIWYEVHVIVPDTLDVAGVTIPGSPAVVIGFNRAVAWTLTNATTDMRDAWSETVDDTQRPTRYRLDDAWKTLDVEVVMYRDSRGVLLSVDTLRRTHRGPLLRTATGWRSYRWTALEPGAEAEALLAANRARTVDELFDALTQFNDPSLNVLAADTSGSVALHTIGHHPRRAPDARGDQVQDGSRSATDWRGYRADASQPTVRQPSQGWIASANQEQFDPRTDSSYWGASWPAPWRAMRIGRLLRRDASWTVERLAAMQTEPGNERAEAFVPVLLGALPAVPCTDQSTDPERHAARILACWDRRFTGDSPAPLLFERTMWQMALRTWDEIRTDKADDRTPLPGDAVLLQLTTDSASIWWDRIDTPQLERRDVMVRAAVRAAWEELHQEWGEPVGGRWAWSRQRFAAIPHLLRIGALGRDSLPVSGGNGTISPSTGAGTHGASWRMVVSLQRRPQAMATYPGGQRGHPLSRFYADRIGRWQQGRLDTMRLPSSPDALPMAQRVASLTLLPKGADR